MNTELKALLNLIFDGCLVVKDVIEKKDVIQISSDLFKSMTDVPGVISQIEKLRNEFESLKGNEVEADLFAFIEQKFGPLVDGKQKLILSASLDFIKSGVELGKIIFS